MPITTMRTDTNIEDYLNDKEEIVGYAYINQLLHQIDINHPQCCAKSIKSQNTKTTRYFILEGQDKTIYNPLEVNQREINNVIRGNKFWNWIKTSKDTFELYLQYIKTGNAHYYRTVEKRINLGE